MGLEELNRMAGLAKDLQAPVLQIPRQVTLFLDSCSWEFILDANEQIPTESRLRLSLFTPIFAFARIDIPLEWEENGLSGAKRFADNVADAVVALEKAVHGELPSDTTA